MKVFVIKNIKTDEVYYVQHKERFCSEFDLTRRVLDRTFHGERNHHKGFVLVDRNVEFVFDNDGQATLHDTGAKGFLVSVSEEEHVSTTKDEALIDAQKREIAELKEKLANSTDNEEKDYIKKLEKKVQFYMDNNRILRKHKREGFRTETVVDNFFDEVLELLPTLNPYYPVSVDTDNDTEKKLIVNLSDLHFGKRVEMKSNEFNFKIAEARLMNYADKSIRFANDNGIDTVYITMTGDNFMLSHRRDQLLSQEDNRAVSFVKGFDITRKFYERFLAEGLYVKTVGVLGNESRVVDYEFQSNHDSVASENFDYLLFQMLKRHFGDTVEFLNDCDTLSHVFEVNGKNIALTHGDKLKHDYDNVNKFKMRMLEENGVVPDTVILGHIHSYLATSTFVRSASLCGGDGYSSNGLNIYGSVASQVMLVIEDDIRAMEIRL